MPARAVSLLRLGWLDPVRRSRPDVVGDAQRLGEGAESALPGRHHRLRGAARSKVAAPAPARDRDAAARQQRQSDGFVVFASKRQARWHSRARRQAGLPRRRSADPVGLGCARVAARSSVGTSSGAPSPQSAAPAMQAARVSDISEAYVASLISAWANIGWRLRVTSSSASISASYRTLTRRSAPAIRQLKRWPSNESACRMRGRPPIRSSRAGTRPRIEPAASALRLHGLSALFRNRECRPSEPRRGKIASSTTLAAAWPGAAWRHAKRSHLDHHLQRHELAAERFVERIAVRPRRLSSINGRTGAALPRARAAHDRCPMKSSTRSPSAGLL